MKKEIIGCSKNSVMVWFDPVSSHAATHIEDTPQLKELVKEILAGTILPTDEASTGKELRFDKDMGRTVGTSDGVDIDENDVLVYAKRKNRDTYTVFTKSRQQQPCSVVTVALARQKDGSYELLSTWIGGADSPPFPGDPDATPESKEYWSKHALVWGSQEVQPGTETDICPW